MLRVNPFYIVPLTDPSLLDRSYRVEDELECSMYGATGAEAARACFTHGEESYSIYCEGELVGFCGYRHTGLFGPADIWLLTLDSVERHKLSFVRFVRTAVGYLRQRHSLRVHVPYKYARALRLASAIGFTFVDVGGGFVQGVMD